MDRVALGSIATLAVAVLFVIVRGDSVGVQLTHALPAPGEENASTRGRITLTFSEPMDQRSLAGRIHIAPDVTGTLRLNGATAVWISPRPLQSDTVYTVTVDAGVTSARGRRMPDDATWTFRTGHPRLAYLAPANGASDLYVLDALSNGPPERLTQEPFGVYDFAISPDGRRLVYSVNREEGNPERDLYLINSDGSGREMLAKCDGQVCQAPSWSPDGARVAFERRELIEGAVGRSPGPARIWLIDVDSREASALFADSQQIGSLPRFAPSGDRLSFYDPLQNAVTVVETSTSELVQLPSLLGDPGTWSPDANQLVYPELQAHEAGQFQQLLRADLVTNVITAITPLSATNDSGPVWSPLGEAIVFGRQATGGGHGILGAQVWLTTPEGENPRQLTDEPEFTHGGYAWSPDGAWIAIQRFNLLEPNARPEIWLIRPEGGERRKLAEDAILPAWIP
jgi:Tol biopolymer transport system component